MNKGLTKTSIQGALTCNTWNSIFWFTSRTKASNLSMDISSSSSICLSLKEVMIENFDKNVVVVEHFEWKSVLAGTV